MVLEARLHIVLITKKCGCERWESSRVMLMAANTIGYPPPPIAYSINPSWGEPTSNV
jgi:hypothetical protein